VRADRRGILPIKTWPLMHAKLDRLYDGLPRHWAGIERISLRSGIGTDKNMIVLEEESGSLRPLAGPGYIHEEIAGALYRISAGSFFQVNSLGTEALVAAVLELVDPTLEDVVLDLYSGVGLFSLPLARCVRKVVAVESLPEAVDDARWSVKNAGLYNCDLVQGDVDSVLGDLNPVFSAAVVDPPRRGCSKRVIDRLVGLHMPRLVYFSCNPATLARDARLLVDRKYRLVEVRLFDLFPQTPHVECVALFVPE